MYSEKIPPLPFGGDAGRYDRARPDYPEKLICRITAVGARQTVLDVGCGSGIEGMQFREHGCDVLGIEPDAALAAFAKQRGLTVEIGTFDDWDPAGRTFDIVVAGTSWHWVDPVAAARKAAVVLRPGGVLAPFWNTSTVPIPIEQAFVDAFQQAAAHAQVSLKVDRQGVAGYREILDRTTDGIRQTGRFLEPEEWTVDWKRDYGRDAWLEEIQTWGIVRALDRRSVAEIVRAVGAAVDAHGGDLTVDYTSVVVEAALNVD